MAKTNIRYVCTECRHTSPKWQGQCPSCGEYNTMVEDSAKDSTSIAGKQAQSSGGRVIPMRTLDAKVTIPDRMRTGIGELDSVLGGGLVRGSATLISGEPGIGKSTLLIQAIASIARNGLRCAYVSGEEAEDQVRLRAQRLGLTDAPVQLAHETAVRDIIATLRDGDVQVAVIDSIQKMAIDTADGAAGGVGQVKASSDALIEYAKTTGCALIIVGHVTKDGNLAGPRHLEHMVDTVLSFEGDRSHQYRLLRAVKNRFGATDEVGVFEMAEIGLKEVLNPSSLFLVDRDDPVSGVVVLPTVEGGRAILVEIQALVVKRADQGYPRRACVGWDKNRLDMILAILEARFGLPLGTADVYVNVAGGYRVADPAADLAVAAAVMSAFTDKPVKAGTAVFGELSLSGDVRPVPHMSLRLREAERLGFDAAIGPRLPSDVSARGIAVDQIRSFHPIANRMYGKE